MTPERITESGAITFHKDPSPGVAPYLQLIQQVKHSLRMGQGGCGHLVKDRDIRVHNPGFHDGHPGE